MLAGKDIYNEFKRCNVIAGDKRNTQAWVGGSIVASLEVFNPMWISKREYDEKGVKALNNRSFDRLFV